MSCTFLEVSMKVLAVLILLLIGIAVGLLPTLVIWLAWNHVVAPSHPAAFWQVWLVLTGLIVLVNVLRGKL